MTDVPSEFTPAAPLRPVLRTRASAFSYECRACGRCCREKLIPVNPYEIARLAVHLGISTTDFIQHYTDGGTALAVRPDVTCIFLDGSGCGVHADRPLACRLYPLGLVRGPGGEVVVELEAQPGSEGVRGENGTVADFLEAQGVTPFLDASRRYHAVLDRLVAALSAACGPEHAAEALTGDGDESAAPEFLDIDAALRLLARRGETIPASVDDRVTRHIAYLDELVATTGG